MTTQTTDAKKEALRGQWLEWIGQLLSEIGHWADARHWSTHCDRKSVEDEELGKFTVPTLRLRPPGGIVHIEPGAYNVVGGKGRVDIEAWPSLHRIILIHDQDTWRLISEFGEHLNETWGEATFVRLAKELIEQA